MKIVCKKETNISKMLELARHLLETEYADYPLLAEDLVLEISLKSKDCTALDNASVIHLEEKNWQDIPNSSNDALTKLYNRGKYERDIARLQADNAADFACVYIDVVGLHEINNHLGHAAGDAMLCRIADGIRQNFSHSLTYRIGGDEFVIFCLHQTEAAIQQAVSNLRHFLSKDNYEISVGIHQSNNRLSVMETINQAEYAMRYDKARFYEQNGAKRQMRSLNYKLEKILLEKQDANQFLNVIAAEYKGVYMVNPDTDTCRYIYIPEYFKEILQNNDHVFSTSLRIYCDTFICERDKERFLKVLDFDTVLNQIKQGNQIKFSYEKNDGSNVHLHITIYDPNSSNSNEMLWIFMDGDQ